MSGVGAAVPDAREDAIYRALGDGNHALADTVSAQWLADGKANAARALAARIDVLEQRRELAKPAGDALKTQLDAFTAAHPHGEHLALRFDLWRQLEIGQRAQVNARAVEALAALHEDRSTDAIELDRIIGCTAMIAATDTAVMQPANAARAVLQRDPSLRARFHEYQMLYCIFRANARAARETAAIAVISDAEALAARTFGEDSALRLAAASQAAGELENLGRLQEELQIREDILQRARRHFGDRNLQTAEAEAGYGACLQQLGDYVSSRAHYEASEKILAGIETPPNVRLRVLVNFANALQEIGDEAAALSRYQTAYAMIATKPGAEGVRAIILTNTGNTEFRLHQLDAAAEHYRQALQLREQSDGKNAPALAFALEGLGSVELLQRRYQEALDHFSRALALRQSVATKDQSQHVQMLSLRFGIAMAKWGLGDLEGAFALSQETAERVQNLVAGIAANLPERQSVALREQMPPATALVVTLAAVRGDRASVEAAWQRVIRDRGLIARVEARRLAETRAKTDPALDASWQTWRTASSALADGWIKADATDAKIQALRDAAETAERHFWARAGIDPARVNDDLTDVAALAAALPRDGLLVAMAEGLKSDPSWPMTTGRTQLPEEWYAFRLGADGAVQLADLGRIDAISAQARAWYASLSNAQSSIDETVRRGADVRKAVFDPLHAMDVPRHLFFVPDGELFRASLAALPVNGKYVIETGLRVHTLSNEAELLAPPAQAVGKIVLAGAPSFGATTNVTSSRQLCQRAISDGFPMLPHAKRELESLRTVFSGSDVAFVEGDNATKQTVAAALPGASVIHLATHGFSLDQTCSSASDARSMTVAMDRHGADAETMTLSGLAFSGARVSDERNAVGVLSADDFASMDLSKAGWVVLSACDSGLGPIGRSEGVFGMRRAIRMAGARTVVMSLWEVDDASTADLMQTLYRARFVDHHDAPTSLADAMLATLRARRAAGQSDHPYYWAAFIGEGGWK